MSYEEFFKEICVPESWKFLGKNNVRSINGDILSYGLLYKTGDVIYRVFYLTQSERGGIVKKEGENYKVLIDNKRTEQINEYLKSFNTENQEK